MSIEGIRKIPFPSKKVYKRVRGRTSGQSLPEENFIEYPPRDCPGSVPGKIFLPLGITCGQVFYFFGEARKSAVYQRRD